MAEHIGRRVNLGIARESSRGVGVAPTFWMPRTELTFNDRAGKVVSGESHGHIDDSTDAFVTEKFADGSIGGEVRTDSFGLLLYAMLGSLSTATVSGAQEHTFTEANTNQHQSLSFVIDDPVSDKMFELCMLNSLTISVVPGEIVTYSADWMSRNSVTTTQTATYTSEDRFIGKHVAMKVAATIAGLSGASAIPLKSFDITFSKNIVRDHETGTVVVSDILNQQFGVEGSFSLNFENNTQRALVLDNTYQALELAAINSDVTIGSTNPELTTQLGRVNFSDWDVDQSLDTISTETINFKGMADIANSVDIVSSVVLRNETNSY